MHPIVDIAVARSFAEHWVENARSQELLKARLDLSGSKPKLSLPIPEALAWIDYVCCHASDALLLEDRAVLERLATRIALNVMIRSDKRGARDTSFFILWAVNNV